MKQCIRSIFWQEPPYNYKYKPDREWRRTWNDKQDCTLEYL